MIRGQQITLRAIEREDLPLLQKWMNDPDIARQVGGFSFPVSAANQEGWYNSLSLGSSTQRFMVEFEGKAIGMSGLYGINWIDGTAEYALKLDGQRHGKGLGTDVSMTTTAYAFQRLGLRRLEIDILCFNQASIAIHERKVGYKVEGVSRQKVLRDGAYYDQVHLGLLKDEFYANPLAAPYLTAPLTPKTYSAGT